MIFKLITKLYNFEFLLGCLRTSIPKYVLESSMNNARLLHKFQGVPNNIRLIWLHQNDPNETDMSETRGVPLRLIRLRHWNQSLLWYDRDVKLTIDSHMTEIPWPKLSRIWLRRPKNFVLTFQFCTLETATRLKITMKKIWAIPVISVQVWLKVSQPYQSQG